MTDADDKNPIRDHVISILTRLEAGEGHVVYSSTDFSDPEWVAAWAVVLDTDNNAADQLSGPAPPPQYMQLSRKGIRALRTLRANDQNRLTTKTQNGHAMTDPTTTAGFERGLPSQLGQVTMFTPGKTVDEHVTDTLRAKAATVDARLAENA